VDDRFIWCWSASSSYSVPSAYGAMLVGQTQILGARELWKVKALNMCCFFLWLVLHGKNWTSECAWHHDLRDDECCALCDQEAETMDHLLVACPYAREIWFKALRCCGWKGLATMHHISFTDWWLLMRNGIPKQRRKAFDSFIVLCAWSIWLERNARVFDGRTSSPTVKLKALWALCELWCRARFVSRSCLVPDIVA
jgi:hypothetical protein